MTAKEKAQKLLDQMLLIQAYVDGKELQIWEGNALGGGKWHDVKDITPNVFVSKKIRIKPHYTPFTKYDYNLFHNRFVLRNGEENIAYRIINCTDTGVYLGEEEDFVTYTNLVKQYKFIDKGLPVGKIVISEF